MLKIKDNVDLKELEKYGFEVEKDYIINEPWAYIKHSIRIRFRNKKITVKDAHFGEYDIDLIYDLIKDGLVEKV